MTFLRQEHKVFRQEQLPTGVHVAPSPGLIGRSLRSRCDVAVPPSLRFHGMHSTQS